MNSISLKYFSVKQMPFTKPVATLKTSLKCVKYQINIILYEIKQCTNMKHNINIILIWFLIKTYMSPIFTPFEMLTAKSIHLRIVE